jgi:hypothetical protein
LAVTAILLVPVALIEFLVWVGANAADALYGAGVFAITGLLAGYGARRAGASYSALIPADLVARAYVGGLTRARSWLGYVGGFGLLAFLVSVSAQITVRRASTRR